MIRALRSLGTTILLTTHYLDEAQQLADRVAVLRDGEIVAAGHAGGADRRLRDHARSATGATASSSSSRRPSRRARSHELTTRSARRRAASSTSSRCVDPTLEDVYLELVGRGAGATSDHARSTSCGFEQKIFWRSREAAVFVFIFPLLLYALLGSVYGDEIDGVPAEDVLLVGLFGYGAATTAFGGLAIILVVRREAGIAQAAARNASAAARSTSSRCCSRRSSTFALQSVALLALGGLAFGASMPANWLGLRRRDRPRRRVASRGSASARPRSSARPRASRPSSTS